MSTSKNGRATAGFTLIEILVVIGIIAILVAITVAVGGAVMASAKARQTADVIKVVETAIQEVRNSTEAPIPWVVARPSSNGPAANSFQIPLIDGVYRGDTFNGTVQTKAEYPAMAWFIKSITEYSPVPSAEAILNQIDEKFKRISVSNSNDVSLIVATIPGKRMEILDAWGNPLRFVHPQFDGVIPSPQGSVGSDGGAMQTIRDYAIIDTARGAMPEPRFRRNYVSNAERKSRRDGGQPYMRGDSDGGICNGDAPYVYSAGPDGDPSTRADNVYGSVRPKFAEAD